jgi:hypothetical protein
MAFKNTIANLNLKDPVFNLSGSTVHLEEILFIESSLILYDVSILNFDGK